MDPSSLHSLDPVDRGWISRCWPYWQNGRIEEYLASLSRVSRSKCIAAMRAAVALGVHLPIPEVKRGRPPLGSERRLVYPPVVTDAMNELLLRWGPGVLAKSCRGQLVRYAHGWMLRAALNTNTCRPGSIPRIGSRNNPGTVQADELLERFLLWGAGEYVHTIPAHAPLMPVTPGSMIPLSAGQIRQTFAQGISAKVTSIKVKPYRVEDAPSTQQEEPEPTAPEPVEDDPWLAQILSGATAARAVPPELLQRQQEAAMRASTPVATLTAFQQLLEQHFQVKDE